MVSSGTIARKKNFVRIGKKIERRRREEELLFSTAERNDEQKRIDTQTNYTKERKATVITKKVRGFAFKANGSLLNNIGGESGEYASAALAIGTATLRQGYSYERERERKASEPPPLQLHV